MTRGDSQPSNRWRRAMACAAVAAAALTGCQDAPVEGPVDAAARPLRIASGPAECIVCDHTEAALALVPLPAIDQPAAAGVDCNVSAAPTLLPPQPLPLDGFTELGAVNVATPSPPAISPLSTHEAASPELAAALAEAQALLADASPTATGSPTGAMVTERAQAKIRRGYALAHRGANYAARNEFLAVLHMIAEAKDQKHGARRRTVALANGLRALEEAEDFAPRGAEFDVNVKLAVIVSSHRTTIAKTPAVSELLPQQLADLYFRYAQFQLAGAVAGEPAGSMALHALGKLYSQLARTEVAANPQADRRAFTLQQAALLARDDNHLAAHELGVLLAETGHFLEAEHLLHQVAVREPHPVVFRNLARVQRKLGHDQFALANEQYAQALGKGATPNNNGILWVPPAALVQAGDGVPAAAPAPHVAAKPAIRKPQPSPGSATALQQPSVQNVSRLPGGMMR